MGARPGFRKHSSFLYQEQNKERVDSILCPGCSSKIGSFSWKGQLCQCGATLSPSFNIIESKLDKELKIPPAIVYKEAQIT